MAGTVVGTIDAKLSKARALFLILVGQVVGYVEVI